MILLTIIIVSIFSLRNITAIPTLNTNIYWHADFNSSESLYDILRFFDIGSVDEIMSELDFEGSLSKYMPPNSHTITSSISVSKITRSIDIHMRAIPNNNKKKTDFIASYNIWCSDQVNKICNSWEVVLKHFVINTELSSLYPKGEIAKSALRNLLSVIRKRSPGIETSITLNAATNKKFGMIGMYYWSKMGFEILQPNQDSIEDLVILFTTYLTEFDISTQFDMKKIDEFLKSLTYKENMPYALTMIAYFNAKDYISVKDYNSSSDLLLGRRFLLETTNAEEMVIYPNQTNRKSTQLFMQNLANQPL